MQRLASYVSGEWREGAGDQEPLYNPATEAVLAETSTAGLDLGAALAYAREEGGAQLRALNFRERGELIAAVYRVLHGAREELIELAVANGGNTRGDSKFDVDGATSTLSAYAALGAELGAERYLLDGAPVDLAGSRIQGWHVRTPRHGVAVHIGAFNFPAWGFAEKAAAAWLAGMPVLTKPAPATALVAWRSVQLLIEANVLPPGALTLVSGAPGDLLDHVAWQDVVAFTGSSSTGLAVRGHHALLERGVRVNVEADSLNAAVLLPGAPSSAVDAFVRDVVRDITQKAGQKCTAIRRVLVPEAELEQVRERLCDGLSQVIVGDPALDQVRMGPLTTALQRERVRAGLAALAGATDVVWGGPDGASPVGVPAGKGYFVGPTLLQARDALAPSPVHEVEVFGPAATLLPYSGAVADAVRIVRRGAGGLVVSVYGDDRDSLTTLVAELAPWHGRIVLIDSKIADKAIAPGTVLPALLHGGPGRAGGGSELGGLRGLELYQQRTAVQGNGPLVARFVRKPS